MNPICERCPIREVCLQAITGKRCPIPTQPNPLKQKEKAKEK